MLKKIYLASSSPRRKDLLKQIIGDNFEIVKSSYEEDNTLKVTPYELVKIHSLGKARGALRNLERGIVIGSDCIVSYDGQVLGKPLEVQRAREMLNMLSGNYVEVISGIALIDVESKKEIVDYEVTKLKMKDLSEKEINEYIRCENPLDNAGAFAIQELGAILIEKIDGDYNNVVGMPLFKLNEMFKEMDVDVYEYN